MSVNGIMNSPSGTQNTTYSSKTSAKSTNSEKSGTSSSSTSASSGVVYEHNTNSSSSAKKTQYKQNTALVHKLKADAEQKNEQFRSLVEKMFTKQGISIGNADNMWKTLAGGNFTVDAATKAQAQKDIAENGYWGVEQTSDRILSFAEALTGGDPDKMEEMRNAFIKGFKQATKSWGKELPSISQNTYDAVMKKFDNYGKSDSTLDAE